MIPSGILHGETLPKRTFFFKKKIIILNTSLNSNFKFIDIRLKLALHNWGMGPLKRGQKKRNQNAPKMRPGPLRLYGK